MHILFDCTISVYALVRYTTHVLILCVYIVLTAIDKTVLLNEMGRMMLMFGDRYNASLFFTKSQQVDVLPINDIFSPTRDLVSTLLYGVHCTIQS